MWLCRFGVGAFRAVRVAFLAPPACGNAKLPPVCREIGPPQRARSLFKAASGCFSPKNMKIGRRGFLDCKSCFPRAYCILEFVVDKAFSCFHRKKLKTYEEPSVFKAVNVIPSLACTRLDAT